MTYKKRKLGDEELEMVSGGSQADVDDKGDDDAPGRVHDHDSDGHCDTRIVTMYNENDDSRSTWAF